MLDTVPDGQSLPLSHQGISRSPRTHARSVTETHRSGKALNYFRQEAWPGNQVIAEFLPMISLSIEGLGELGPVWGTCLGQGLLYVEEVHDGARRC